MKRNLLWCAVLACLLGGGPALASGYLIYEQGANASSQAGAFTARADDASAIFYNPAGITEIDGWQILLGSTAIFLGDTEFSSPTLGTDEMVKNTVLPSHLYLTNRASEHIAWGLGLYTPFGLETEWDENSPLRFSSRHAEVHTIYLSGILGIRINDQFSIAVGLSYVTGEVRAFSRNIDLGFPISAITLPSTAGQEAFTNLRGDATDYTWNLGFQYRSENGFFFGLTYRGKAELEISDGTVEYHGVPSALILTEPGVNLQSKFVDGGGSATLPLPATAALGFGWEGGGWSFEFDVAWAEWSDFQTLELSFENQSTIQTPLGPAPVVADQSIAENWHNTRSWRFGLAYAFTDQHEIRGGIYTDENPIPAETVRPSLPDDDRWSGQIGYGFTTGGGRFGLDVYYQYIVFDDRLVGPVPGDPSVIAGVYKTSINLFGGSVRFQF